MFHLNLGTGFELRLLQEPDAEEMFRVVGRNREQLHRWLPWVDATTSAEDSRQFILKSLEQFASREALAAGIVVDGAFAGAIAVHKIDFPNCNASIGYWLDSAQQGRGLMTTACRAMVTYAFAEYGLHRVEIRCATANVKSCGIPERLGFVREGVVRHAQRVNDRFLDLVVWGMLAPDWKA